MNLADLENILRWLADRRCTVRKFYVEEKDILLAFTVKEHLTLTACTDRHYSIKSDCYYKMFNILPDIPEYQDVITSGMTCNYR